MCLFFLFKSEKGKKGNKMSIEKCTNCGRKFLDHLGVHESVPENGHYIPRWFCCERCFKEYEAAEKAKFNAKLDKLGGGNRLKGAAIHDLGIIYWAFAAAIWILKKLIPAMFSGLAAAIAVSGKVLWFLCKILFKVLRFLLKIGFKIFVFALKVALYIPYLLVGLIYKTMGLLYRKKAKKAEKNTEEAEESCDEDEELAEDDELSDEELSDEDDELAEDAEFYGEDEELAEDAEACEEDDELAE